MSFDREYEPIDLGRTTVEVSGVEVDLDSTDGWTYDSVDNAIVFHGYDVPDVARAAS